MACRHREAVGLQGETMYPHVSRPYRCGFHSRDHPFRDHLGLKRVRDEFSMNVTCALLIAVPLLKTSTHVRVWDRHTGECIRTLPGHTVIEVNTRSSRPHAHLFQPSGHRMHRPTSSALRSCLLDRTDSRLDPMSTYLCLCISSTCR